jgi:hypothetical protein
VVVPRFLLALLTALLVLPVSVHATLRTIAPPGNSAVTQYLETVPTDQGQSPPSTPGSPQGQNQGDGTLSASQTHQLDSLGSHGRTLVAVVNATSPAPAHPAERRGGNGPGQGAPHPTARHRGSAGVDPGLEPRGSGSPFSSLVSAAIGHGGGGIGIATLALIVCAALIGAWRGTRRALRTRDS